MSASRGRGQRCGVSSHIKEHVKAQRQVNRKVDPKLRLIWCRLLIEREVELHRRGLSQRGLRQANLGRLHAAHVPAECRAGTAAAPSATYRTTSCACSDQINGVGRQKGWCYSPVAAHPTVVSGWSRPPHLFFSRSCSWYACSSASAVEPNTAQARRTTCPHRSACKVAEVAVGLAHLRGQRTSSSL